MQQSAGGDLEDGDGAVLPGDREQLPAAIKGWSEGRRAVPDDAVQSRWGLYHGGLEPASGLVRLLEAVTLRAEQQGEIALVVGQGAGQCRQPAGFGLQRPAAREAGLFAGFRALDGEQQPGDDGDHEQRCQHDGERAHPSRGAPRGAQGVFVGCFGGGEELRLERVGVARM